MEKLIVRTIALVVITLILTVGSCVMHSDYRISKAIEDGADPLVARMAFESGAGMADRAIYMGQRGYRSR